MWFLLADFEKLYKPHEPPRNPTLRYQNVRGMSMLWDPSRNEENQCLGFYDMTFGQVYILVCKIFCTHTTLNSIMSCFHFREKDSLSRAKTQTLLQEDMISNSHSTPGRNRSSRKRVSKIDVRRLNVSTFVFFFNSSISCYKDRCCLIPRRLRYVKSLRGLPKHSQRRHSEGDLHAQRFDQNTRMVQHGKRGKKGERK